jgi:hypothetical protein
VSLLFRHCGILNISQPDKPPRPRTGIAFPHESYSTIAGSNVTVVELWVTVIYIKHIKDTTEPYSIELECPAVSFRLALAFVRPDFPTLCSLCMLPAPFWFFAWLTLRPWRLKRYIALRRRPSSKLHGVTAHLNALFRPRAPENKVWREYLNLRKEVRGQRKWLSEELNNLFHQTLRLPRARSRNRVSIPGRGKRFFSSPYRSDSLWSLTIPLFSGYQGLSLPGNKAAGAKCNQLNWI